MTDGASFGTIALFTTEFLVFSPFHWPAQEQEEPGKSRKIALYTWWFDKSALLFTLVDETMTATRYLYEPHKHKNKVI